MRHQEKAVVQLEIGRRNGEQKPVMPPMMKVMMNPTDQSIGVA
jgi:hypothetical protein